MIALASERKKNPHEIHILAACLGVNLFFFSVCIALRWLWKMYGWYFCWEKFDGFFLFIVFDFVKIMCGDLLLSQQLCRGTVYLRLKNHWCAMLVSIATHAYTLSRSMTANFLVIAIGTHSHLLTDNIHIEHNDVDDDDDDERQCERW